MAYVDVTDECWNWIGTKNPRGYGRFYDPAIQKTRYTHRMMFEMMCDSSPVEILHECDNTSCVKPTHLRAGTHETNMRDMAKKARGNTVKLTSDAVRHIREAYIAGPNGNSKELRSVYGVDRHTIRQVAKRETWKDVK